MDNQQASAPIKNSLWQDGWKYYWSDDVYGALEKAKGNPNNHLILKRVKNYITAQDASCQSYQEEVLRLKREIEWYQEQNRELTLMLRDSLNPKLTRSGTLY